MGNLAHLVSFKILRSQKVLHAGLCKWNNNNRKEFQYILIHGAQKLSFAFPRFINLCCRVVAIEAKLSIEKFRIFLSSLPYIFSFQFDENFGSLFRNILTCMGRKEKVSTTTGKQCLKKISCVAKISHSSHRVFSFRSERFCCEKFFISMCVEWILSWETSGAFG